MARSSQTCPEARTAWTLVQKVLGSKPGTANPAYGKHRDVIKVMGTDGLPVWCLLKEIDSLVYDYTNINHPDHLLLFLSLQPPTSPPSPFNGINFLRQPNVLIFQTEWPMVSCRRVQQEGSYSPKEQSSTPCCKLLWLVCTVHLCGFFSGQSKPLQSSLWSPNTLIE